VKQNNEQPFTLRKSAKQVRARETVRQILEAATSILEGPEKGLTTNKIAQIAGVSIGSLYQYFPNKEAILNTIIEKNLEKKFKLMSLKLLEMEGSSIEELIEKLVELIIHLFYERSEAKRIFLTELYRLPVRHKLFSIENEFQDRLLEVFSSHSHFRDKSFKELRITTFVLVHSVLGVLKSSLSNGQDINPEDLKCELKHLVLSYCLK